MIQALRDAAEVVAAVPELGFRAEDAGAIGLSIYISKTKQVQVLTFFFLMFLSM
jgi:hypothetical protein